LIKDGLPLVCSLRTSLILSEKSRHHFVIFSRFLTLAQTAKIYIFPWTFTFCVEKSYDGTHLAFGRTLDRRCLFKHVSLKQSRFYPLPNEHGSQVNGHVRRQCCHNKHNKLPYEPSCDVYFYPDTSKFFCECTFRWVVF
jgi:hypothetical protein